MIPCPTLLKYRNKDNCWICEGWSEQRFEMRTSQIGAAVYIHFEFDKFKPDAMLTTSAG